MERLENEIVCVSVQLNNGFAVINGYMSKDDIEDALNGYYNDDKYFMRLYEKDTETIIYMKNIVMISVQKLKEKKSENKGKGKKRYAVALLKETEDEPHGRNCENVGS